MSSASASATAPPPPPVVARRARQAARAAPRRTRHTTCALLATVGGAAAQDDEPALYCRDVRVTFDGGGRALRGASLTVPAGTVHMLLGRNGCGKSTLLRAAAGLLPGAAVSGEIRAAQPRAFVFQNPDHQVVMPSVGADVAFGMARQALPEQELKTRVEEALHSVGLAGYGLRPIHTLSGGQKQRVAIAGALAERPKLLLLDELTTFLDPGDQATVLAAVRAAVSGPLRVGALWVTHRLEELEQADGASLMDEGRVVFTARSGREMMAHLRRAWNLA